jgi:hypothetical protein
MSFSKIGIAPFRKMKKVVCVFDKGTENSRQGN